MKSPLTTIFGLLSELEVTFPKEIVSSELLEVLLNTEGTDLSPGDTWKQCAPVESP